MKYTQVGLTILFIAACIVSNGQSPDAGSTKTDNTKMNKGDGSSGAVTADQQKPNTIDRELTRNIRRSIMADKSLSTYAHNIKIISQNGAVTLKGPVKTQDEKKAIVAKAVAVTGDTEKVTDKITVAQ